MVLETPTARKRTTSPAGRARRRAANGPCALGSGDALSAMRMSWSVGSTVFSILSGGWRKPGKLLLVGCGMTTRGLATVIDDAHGIWPGQPDGVVLSANRGGASMLRSPGLSAFAALGLAVLGGCTVSPNQARTLLSISVSPATAQDRD